MKIIITEEQFQNIFENGSKKQLTERCWKGYTQKGMKTMFGKKYPNCVKKESVGETDEASSPAQQAAIAINMKKKGIKPKNETLYEDEYGSVEETNFVVGDLLTEAEYQGRKVQLGKINMNLYEDIHKIQSIMGVINEDEVPLIKRMIDDIGLKTAIQMVGDYYAIEPYLTDVDKVNYIKDRVSELGRGGIGFHDMDEEPILVYKNGNEVKQIEFLGKDRAYINSYYRNANVGDERVPYEDLPGQIIDELTEILINK
jgi:hypothetical protein